VGQPRDQFGVRSTPEGGQQAAYLAERVRHTLHRLSDGKTMRYAMSDQTSNRNDAANRKLHIHEDLIAVIFGLTPVIIVFYLLTVK
jgi:hypothetical protein